MTEMLNVGFDRHAVLEDDWKVENDVFESPLVKERPGQMLLFGERLRNGSISADVTILESDERRAQAIPAMEATLVFRYSAPDAYFYAGTGAFGAKFFIGKAVSGPIWQAKKWVGQSSSIRKGKPYRLRIDFVGSQIIFYENDVQQLIVVDEDYQAGQCGFAAWQTRARFQNLQVRKAKPRAFVIMPFKSELDFVHGVIERTITRYGIDCVRADQIAISRPVMQDVKSQIAEADLVIVDFTGKNPNVYYEAGLADAWKKDWIVLAQSTEDLTFDVQHIRCIQYSNTMGADVKLQAALENALSALKYTADTNAPGVVSVATSSGTTLPGEYAASETADKRTTQDRSRRKRPPRAPRN
jgi:hypothetical protein